MVIDRIKVGDIVRAQTNAATSREVLGVITRINSDGSIIVENADGDQLACHGADAELTRDLKELERVDAERLNKLSVRLKVPY